MPDDRVAVALRDLGDVFDRTVKIVDRDLTRAELLTALNGELSWNVIGS